MAVLPTICIIYAWPSMKLAKFFPCSFMDLSSILPTQANYLKNVSGLSICQLNSTIELQ